MKRWRKREMERKKRRRKKEGEGERKKKEKLGNKGEIEPVSFTLLLLTHFFSL